MACLVYNLPGTKVTNHKTRRETEHKSKRDVAIIYQGLMALYKKGSDKNLRKCITLEFKVLLDHFVSIILI